MNKNEIKKALYKEKPTAYLVDVEEDINTYMTKTSLGIHRFDIPTDELIGSNGKLLFGRKEPAQLLIRWLV